MDNILTIEKKWSIGDREFTQSPFGLDRTTALFGLIGELISKIEKKDLDTILQIDTSNSGGYIKLFGILFKLAPDLVKGFIYLCLDVNSEKDIKYIERNLKPTQMISILTEFIKTNDVQEIKSSFLTFWNLAKTELNK